MEREQQSGPLPFAPYNVADWKRLSHIDRIRPMVTYWAENGVGAPPVVQVLYIVKTVIYAVAAILIISLTPGLGSPLDFHTWWDEPIAYQKAVVFTMLIEVLGFGGGFGPSNFRFDPPATAYLHWFRPGTIRLPPWPRLVPLTRGDTRAPADVALFTAFLAFGVAALFAPGTGQEPAGSTAGLMSHGLLAPMVVLLAMIGLRDRTIFLAARSEIYWVALVISLFPYDQMMIGLKVALVAVWVGAGMSKLTHLFPYVVAVMMSNAPLRPKRFKRRMYRNLPHDIRPSREAFVLTHVGSAVEIGVPIFLLFSHGGTATTIAVVIMVVFHLHIISTVPVGVPNEWNVFMIYGALFMFAGHEEFALSNLDNPLLAAFLVLGVAGPVILGNIRPELVSFLPGMRYYAGNWATSLYFFRGDADKKISQNIQKAAGTIPEQITKLQNEDMAEVAMFWLRAFRSLHPQGRAINTLIHRAVEDVEQYRVHDGEGIAGVVLGWSFGDGHLHHEQLLAALQRRCRFEEGELIMLFLESQPLHRRRQWYRIVDAATGLKEQGYVYTKDMLSADIHPGVRVDLIEDPTRAPHRPNSGRPTVASGQRG